MSDVRCPDCGSKRVNNYAGRWWKCLELSCGRHWKKRKGAER